MSEQTTSETITGVIIVFCLIVGGCYFFSKSNRDSYDGSVIQGFLNLPKLSYHQEEDPKIDGHLLIVDKTKSRLDQYYWRFKDATESLPKDPNEIDYVLWVECKEKKVGKYTDGIEAFQEFCNLSLIDLYQNEIIDKKSISGPPPPPKKREDSDYEAKGGHPFLEIKNYVESITQET